MKNKKTYLFLLIGIVVILGVLAFIPPTEEMMQRLGLGSGEEIPAATNNPGWVEYRDDAYGFSIFYPAAVMPETSFKQYYHLSSAWRAMAFGEESTGTPVVAFPLIRTESDNSYPRYFGAEVRIGVSMNPSDVANCLMAGNGDYDKGVEIINGIEFHKFEMSDAGMMQYLAGTSYRTIHNGACWAIEQLRAGSSYRDEPTNNDVPEELLNSYYDSLFDIIKTFSFTK